MQAYGSYHLGSYDVKFDILEGNVDNAFDIMKRVENGMYVGEYWNFIFALCVVKCSLNRASSTYLAFTTSVIVTCNIFVLIKARSHMDNGEVLT